MSRSSLGVLALALIAQLGPPAVAEVRRTDLAAAFRHFEEVFRRSPPPAAARADFERRFDRLTMAAFGMGQQAALQQLGELTGELLGVERTATMRVLESLRIEAEDGAVLRGELARLTVKSMYLVDLEQPVELSVSLRIQSDGETWSLPEVLELRVDEDAPVDATIALPSELTGSLPTRSHVELMSVGGKVAGIPFPLCVIERSLDDRRRENEMRIEALGAVPAGLEHALQSVTARNLLLRDARHENDIARWLIDPQRFATEIDAEIDALAAGVDPFRGRRGEYWRRIDFDGGQLPHWTYVPSSLAEEPRPLLIAMHGAGGDEGMFLHGYGAGEIKRVADTLGVIVVCPLTYPILKAPGSVFDALVEAVAATHDIDRTRIYVLGHSLGALAASAMIQRRDGIAAACFMMGAPGYGDAAGSVPIRAYVGEIDGVIRRGTDAGQADGDDRQYEIVMLRERGHTLAVGDELPGAVSWLLTHRAGAKD